MMARIGRLVRSSWRLPRSVAADLRVIRRRFPREAGTFQAGLLHALLAGWLRDRAAVLSPGTAWDEAGYASQYPDASPDPALVEETRRNLAKALRKLAEEGRLGYAWVVEKARGEGYRLRVVDEERGLVLARGWTFLPFDRGLWERRKVLSLVEGPGHTLGVGLPAWAGLAMAGLALLAGWQWWRGLPDPGGRARAERGVGIAAATCSSSLWDRSGRQPEHAWTRCLHAVDGWIGGQEAWVAYAEGEPTSYGEWIELELAEETAVSRILLHFPHWPCTVPHGAGAVCEAVGRPPRFEVWGRGRSGEWHLLLPEVVAAPRPPWEPTALDLGGASVSAVRVVGRQRAADGDPTLFVYFQVAEVVVVPAGTA